MFSIRPAEKGDAAAIAHVHVQSWRTTYAGIVPQASLESLDEAERTSLWDEWLTLDLVVYVAEVEGSVVGFASGGPSREPQEKFQAELYAMYLLQEVQGQGIGRALLGATTRALAARGLKGLLAWVLEANPARGFYARTGACRIAQKQVEMGGVLLPEAAYAWTALGEGDA